MSGSASGTSTLVTICQRRRAQRLRRLDVAIRHAGDRRHGVRVDERHAGDEDEHHLLRLVDAEPEDGQRDQRGDRQVAAEERQRRAGGLDHAPRAGERCRAARRPATASPKPISTRFSVAAMLCEQRALVEQDREAAQHFARARQDHRRDPAGPPSRRRDVASHQSSDDARHRAGADEPPRHAAAATDGAPAASASRRRPSTWRPAPLPPGRP